MAKTDDEIETPLIGHEFRCFWDRFRILESSRNTDDGSTRADCFAAPVPAHAHRDNEERLEVVSGTLGARVEGRELVLVLSEAGSSVPLFRRVEGRTLIMCGLDHVLFHFSQVPFLAAIFSHRTYRNAFSRAARTRRPEPGFPSHPPI